MLARLVTSAISARAGLDIEELEDLRLAVGELCLLTLQGSDAQSGDVCLELTVLDDSIGVVCTLERAAAAHDASPESEEVALLSEQILDALVDEHGRERRDGSVRGLAAEAPGGACGVTAGREHIPEQPDVAENQLEPLDPAAREELITANLGLAHQLARRFLHRGEPLDDLVQVASVALVKSVDRFDPSAGSISRPSRPGRSSAN